MTCTFFGHKNSPQTIKLLIREAIIELIEKNNTNTFYVGHNGSFDSMVKSVLAELSETYPIKYYVVLAYLPDNSSDNDYEHSLFPEGIENAPKRFSISYRNKWMIDKSDYVIAYITHHQGGAAQFVDKAEKQGKNVINLADKEKCSDGTFSEKMSEEEKNLRLAGRASEYFMFLDD